jgi:Tfp pilus assembly protein PilN
LAPEKRATLRAGFLLSYAQAIVFIVFIVTAFISGTLLSIEFLMKSTFVDVAIQSNTNVQEYDGIAAQMTEINSYLGRLSSVQDQFIDWSLVLEELAGTAPQGTRFESLLIENGNVSIKGTAAVREDVLAMQSRYEALPFITDVSSPLSNILQRTNVRYEFTMRYQAQSTENADVGTSATAP